MDRLQSMAVFVASVQLGSLIAAARHHGLSPSMAGKHVTRLEEEVGARLLNRTTRMLTLTEPGQAFYNRCQHILTEYEAARDEAGDAGGSIHGLLRVSAPLLYGTMRLRPLFTSFMLGHPRIKLEVNLEDEYIDLGASNVDLAVRIGRLADSALIGRKLEICPMMLCGAPSLVGYNPARDTLEAARAYKRLAFNQAASDGDWTMHAPSGEAYKIDGPFGMRSNNMTILTEAALAGLGIVYGPALIFESYIKRGALRPILPSWNAPELLVQAVYTPSNRPSAKVRALLNSLVEGIAGRGG